MPKVSAQHRAEQRKRILDAALACFSRHGVQGTSIDDICQEAGVSAGTFYVYFKNKDAVTSAVAEQECDWVESELSSLLSDERSARPALLRLAESYRKRYGSTDHVIPAMNVMLWAEAIRNPEVARMLAESSARVRELLARLIAEGQRRGEINAAVEPMGGAEAVSALGQGLILELALGSSDVSGYVAAARALLTGEFWTNGGTGGRHNQTRISNDSGGTDPRGLTQSAR